MLSLGLNIPFAYLVDLIIIITVIIRHKVVRTEHRDSSLVVPTKITRDRSSLSEPSSTVSKRLAPHLLQKRKKTRTEYEIGFKENDFFSLLCVVGVIRYILEKAPEFRS